MGLRFFRRVRIAPGISVNFSRSGPSLSLGVRGAHVTLGRRGITKTIGLPGTGVFYTSRSGYHSGYHSAVPALSGEPGLGGSAFGALLAVFILAIAAFFAIISWLS
jgi:hypothetical protein